MAREVGTRRMTAGSRVFGLAVVERKRGDVCERRD